jgi:hypothetical protein
MVRSCFLAALSLVLTVASASAACYGLSYQLHAKTASGKDLKCFNVLLESSIGTFETEQSAMGALDKAIAIFTAQKELSCDIVVPYEDTTDYSNAKAVEVSLILDTLGPGSIDGDACDTVYSYRGVYTYDFTTALPVNVTVDRGSPPLTAEQWKALNNAEPDNR